MRVYKVVRRNPDTGGLVDAYTGALSYEVGVTVADISDHGLSVHTTPSRALAHKIPAGSVGRAWLGALIEVEVGPGDILSRGAGAKKTLVRRLHVMRIVEDRLHPDIIQCGLSPARLADGRRWIAQGWGGFVEVATIRRGSPSPKAIDCRKRAQYRIECRPATAGTYGKSVEYRAVLLADSFV